jgi:hypothetical protein
MFMLCENPRSNIGSNSYLNERNENGIGGGAFWRPDESKLTDEDFEPQDPREFEKLLHQNPRPWEQIGTCALQERELQTCRDLGIINRFHLARFQACQRGPRRSLGRSRAPARRRAGGSSRSSARASDDGGDGGGPSHSVDFRFSQAKAFGSHDHLYLGVAHG